jgi:diguanylate cyclase (GGDEF)-like protein
MSSEPHSVRGVDPLLAVLLALTVAVVPFFAFSGAPASVLLPLYWALELVFQGVLAFTAHRVSRLYRAGEHDPYARAGRRFWRYCALACSIIAVGHAVQLVHVVGGGPTNSGAYMGTGFLLTCVVAGVLILTVGLLRHPGRISTSQERSRLRQDSATVLAGAATFGVLVVRVPSGSFSASWLFEFGVNMLAQPVMFLLLLFAVLRLTLGRTGPFGHRAGGVLGLAAVVMTVTQSFPEWMYLSDGVAHFWAFGASLVGAGLAAVGGRLQERQVRPDAVAAPARPGRPYSLLPYAAMTATWALNLAVLITQGLTWRCWAVVAGMMVTTALVVFRQLAAFRHNAQLLHERDELTARLTELAFRDGLTGLANRVAFMNALNHSLCSGVPVTVLLIDLDRFKPVNDAFGHATGDQLLIEVGRRLCHLAGAGDTIARLGGDEFAVLTTEGSAATAEALAAHVRRSLSGTVRIGAAEVPLSGTVGIAVGTGEHHGPDSLLHAADMDMYARKNTASGRTPDRISTPTAATG